MSLKELILASLGTVVAVYAVVVGTWGSWSEFRLAWRDPKGARQTLKNEMFIFLKVVSLWVVGIALFAFVFDRLLTKAQDELLLTNAQYSHFEIANAQSENDYLKTMRALKNSCEEFSAALQQCSIAGDIDRCAQIKTAHLQPTPTSELCPVVDDLTPTWAQCFWRAKIGFTGRREVRN